MRGILGIFSSSLKWKVLALALFPLACFLVLFPAYIVPSFESGVIEAKKGGIRQVVESAASILAMENEAVTNGTKSLAEAQKEAVGLLNGFKFDGTNYVFALEAGPRIVAHGARPELIGQPPDKLNPTLLALYQNFERVSIEQSTTGGFHAYQFSKPGQAGMFPKVTYVYRFQPWGWTIAAGAYVDDVDRETGKIKLGLIISVAIVAILVIAVSASISKRMIVPMSQLLLALQHTNLRSEIHISSRDEIGQVAEAFNTYNAGLRDTILEVGGYSDRVASGSTELATTSLDMARAVEQIAQVSEGLKHAGEEVVSAMAQLLKNVDGMDRQTLDTTKASAEAVEDTARGTKAGVHAQEGMSAIRTVTDQIVQAVQAIQGIARQTNLLSLNAAIEAAKAGIHGKGFAVVAEEIRKLAEQSATSARQIEEQVHATQSVVLEGEESVRTTLKNLESIRACIERVATRIHTVSDLGRAQSATSRQVEEMMRQTTQKLASNAASTNALAATVKDVSRTADDLSKIAEGLRSVIKGFRV